MRRRQRLTPTSVRADADAAAALMRRQQRLMPNGSDATAAEGERDSDANMRAETAEADLKVVQDEP